MRILLLALIALCCLSGCGFSTSEPKKVEAKPAPTAKKEDKRIDHVLDNVQEGPTYGDKALRTYQGAKEVKKQIDQQVKEQNDLQKDAD